MGNRRLGDGRKQTEYIKQAKEHQLVLLSIISYQTIFAYSTEPLYTKQRTYYMEMNKKMKFKACEVL